MHSVIRHLSPRRASHRFILRQCHGQSNQNAGFQAKQKASDFFNKIIDNPLPLGVGALVVGVLQWRRIQEREARKLEVAERLGEVVEADPWQVTCYRSLPLRHVSRLWGWINDVNLPVFLRSWIISLYVRSFGCNLEEAECTDLQKYNNLGQFFRRRLKTGCRVIDDLSEMVSPCDGKVLHWGSVDAGSGVVEQVKGISYSLKHFLGKEPELSSSSERCRRLYQCVLYLAPGDYHGFHSPADWSVETRRHFPGDLLSVNPGIVRRIPALFCLNERVVYSGTWRHGFISMTAVGATNVGSVKVVLDPELATNTRKWETDTFHQKVWDQGKGVKKGEYFGEFNLGSTIVLIFEAPHDFEFNFASEGDTVRVGGSVIKRKKAVEKEETQSD